MSTAPGAEGRGERLGWVDAGLILAASLPLFIQLGELPIWGSEARWLEISSGMAERGNWVEPLLREKFYGDKPLLSYWAIVVAAMPFGRVDEGVARVPSALAGAATALLTGWMAARLFSRRCGILSGCILVTAYSFHQWSRTASADLINVAFATAAVAVYLESKRCFRPWHPLAFFALLALGGNAKGMPAVILPLAIVAVDAVLSRRFDLIRQAGWIAAGLVLGAMLYLTPFVLSYLSRGDWELLRLMWRENFVRAIDAFDHVAPPYYYLYTLPAMFLPWTPWLLAGLGWAGLRSRSHPEFRFALLSFLVVFLAFTTSESRRSYYILPIFPFAAIVSAAFLVEVLDLLAAGQMPRKLWSALALLPIDLLTVALGLGSIFVMLGPFLPGAAGELARALPLRGLLTAVVLLGFGGLLAARLYGGSSHRLIALAAAAVLAAVYVSTGGDLIRSRSLCERPFAREVRTRFPAAKLYYDQVNSRLRHYVGAYPDVEGPDGLKTLLSAGEEVLLVCEPTGRELLRKRHEIAVTELCKATVPAFGPIGKAEDRYFLVSCRLEKVAEDR